jgi:N-acetylmuramoyl-L-alanine amidase
MSMLGRWWNDLRFFWHTRNKAPLVAVLFVGSVALTGVSLIGVFESRTAQRQELHCLALNIYHEARGESRAGQQAVAEVTMNRVASPRYPDTVCEVVFQKNWDYLRKRYVGAFSWTEFDVRKQPFGESWTQAQEIAEQVYFRRLPTLTKGALHYHARYIRPSWSKKKKPLARIGQHVFYK